MNKEEKEAIAFLRRDIKFRKNNKWFENCIIEPKTAQILLNYIDKLQKELDKLKEVDKQICCEELITKDKYQDILKENEELKVDNKKLNDLLMFSELDYVSKDIIRDKIKELEEKDKASSTNIYGYGVKFLKELLGE